MKKNMGKVDRAIRLLLVVLVLVLYFTHVISGTLGIILMAVAGILAVTSIFGVCPLYMPLGLNTGKK
jgi:hypothetical protein